MPKPMPEQHKAAFDAIMGSLNRVAMTVVETPKSQRDEIYKTVRDLYSATLKDKLSKKDADEFLAMYMARLRDLVDIIEAGGGAAGGHA